MGRAALKKHEPVTPTAEQHESPWGEIATEHGSQTILKYIKGDWLIGEDEVPLGTKYVAFIDELACGFIKFNEDEAPDVHLAKVKFGRDKLPKRDGCGDVDQSEWEVGDDGKPKDPWQPIMQLPLSPVDHVGELVVFSAIGEGGARGAVADLCGVYDRSPRHGLLPIIALGTRHYMHKKYGKVHVPVLKLESWHRTGLAESESPPPKALPSKATPPTPAPSDYGAPWDDDVNDIDFK
jgi:hypothetical protein